MAKTATLALPLVGVLAMAGMAAGSAPAAAADLPMPVHNVRAARCGACGCLHVTYNYHRELLATYGVGFDPRSYDMTEPRYFYGAVRAYPHYWVAADGAQ